MGAELRPFTTDDEWEAFHSIRERVLWTARGRVGYDRAHPDDVNPRNVPMLLLVDAQPTGVIRVDVEPPVAWFRLVAIREDRQRRGYGRQMLSLATDFAANRGCTRIRSNVVPDAVEFYRKLDFEEVHEDAGEDVRMRKIL